MVLLTVTVGMAGQDVVASVTLLASLALAHGKSGVLNVMKSSLLLLSCRYGGPTQLNTLWQARSKHTVIVYEACRPNELISMKVVISDGSDQAPIARRRTDAQRNYFSDVLVRESVLR